MPTQSPLYVGLLMMLVLLLGLNASRMRVKLKIYLGDGGNKAMAAAERAHGNTVEHAMPLAILLVMMEVTGAPKSAIPVLGSLAVAARALRSGGMLARLKAAGLTGVVMTYGLEAVMSI